MYISCYPHNEDKFLAFLETYQKSIVMTMEQDERRRHVLNSFLYAVSKHTGKIKKFATKYPNVLSYMEYVAINEVFREFVR